METKFNHSIKVPNQYKKAAKVLKNSLEKGASVKEQIFTEKHAKTNRLYALISKFSNYKYAIDAMLEQSQILEKETRLDKYLCYVLVTELMFGAKKLNGESKPVTCVRSYEDRFKEILDEINNKDKTEGNVSAHQCGPKPRYVRINTNLMSRSEAYEAFVNDGWIEVKCENYDEFLDAIANLTDEQFISDIHVKNLFIFPASSKRYWALSKLTKESKVILQDKASCLPSFLLSPKKGSCVLDMCAAPGMKTSHLAAIMKNRGTIWAVERDTKRYGMLSNFVQKTDCKIVKPINADILSIDPTQYEKVEYILLDPPCSGSGMTNRFNIFGDSSSNNPYGTDRLFSLSTLQSKMLFFALQSFPNAKKLVYSTCSVNVEENEQVIQRVMEQLGETDWKLVKPLEFAETWKNFGSPKYKHIGKKCLYAKPEVDRTDGFFVAIFEREFQNQEAEAE